MCCEVGPFIRAGSVISSLFLVADMISDGLNVWSYHDKAYAKNGNESNFFGYFFYYNRHREYVAVDESFYFIISFATMLLPVVVATVCLLFYLLYVYFMEIRQFFINRCCNVECGTIASSLMTPFTLIFCLALSIVVIFLSWIVSPILHILFSFFLFFGNKPSGKSESKLKVRYFPMIIVKLSFRFLMKNNLEFDVEEIRHLDDVSLDHRDTV